MTALAWVVNDEAPREVHVAAELADLPAAGPGVGWLEPGVTSCDEGLTWSSVYTFR